MRRAGGIAAALLAAGIVAAAGNLAASTEEAAAGPPTLELHPVGNFFKPDYVAQPPGSRHLVFVVEKPGTIRVVRDGTEVGHPFLDISDRVETTNDDGLGSIAFDPGYRDNRRFYVFYTRNGGDNEVDVFKRSRHSPTRAVAASRRKVIVIDHPDSGGHNGAQIQFGPDGHLYISSGDGDCCGDPYDHARKLDTLLGKILRIDPRPNGGYTVPGGNPRVGKPGLDEIFSWGLRNPWRFSFDRRTGRISIGEVGDANVEEVDYETIKAAKGANFGWPEWEGSQHVDPSRPGPGPPVAPIFSYTHADTGGCAVIGGYVVRDPGLGSLEGRYVYTDLCLGEIRGLRPSLGGAQGDRSLGLNVATPTTFGEGYHGRIYVASFNGPVYRLVER